MFEVLDKAIKNPLRRSLVEAIGPEAIDQRLFDDDWFYRGPITFEDIPEDRIRRETWMNLTNDVAIISDEDGGISIEQESHGSYTEENPRMFNPTPEGLRFLQSDTESRKERTRNMVEAITRMILGEDVPHKHHTARRVLGQNEMEKDPLNSLERLIPEIALSDRVELSSFISGGEGLTGDEARARRSVD